MEQVGEISDLEEQIREAIKPLLNQRSRQRVERHRQMQLALEGLRRRETNNECQCRHDASCPLQREVENLRRCQRENNELRQEIAVVSRGISDAKIGNNELKVALRSAQDRIMELRSQLEAQLEEHQTQISKLDRQFKQAMEEQKASHIKQITDMQKQNKEVKDEQDKKLADRDQVIKDLVERVTEVERRQQ